MCPCSQQYYFQETKGGSNPTGHQQMSKQNMVCTNNGILFSLTKEENFDIDELRRHDAK